MGKLNMTRRTFVKAAAVTGAAAILSSYAAPTALAKFHEELRVIDPASTGDVKRIRTACRGCGKCECGVFVTVENGRAVKIEGDEAAYHVNGNCCTKSQASVQAFYHPDRLIYPMKRTNPKGDNPGWQRITWDEVYATSVECLDEIAEKYGSLSIATETGTSRFWAMGAGAIAGLWGPTNGCGAAEICKGPRRCAGSLTVENGIFFHGTVDYPLVYTQWGTDQTQSNYDDSCRMVTEASRHAKIFISIDPRISNCGKDADYRLAIKPGTDGALALAWTRIVMEKELYDEYIMKYWSNAPYLYCPDVERTGTMTAKLNKTKGFTLTTRLLKESDMIEGVSPLRFMVWNDATDKLTYFDADEKIGMWEMQTEHDIPTTGWEYERGGMMLDYPKMPADLDPALWGEYPVTLKDGKQVKCKTVFQMYWDEVVDMWTIDAAAKECDLDAKLIEESCLAYATRIDPRRGNGGLNAQLAPEQCGNNIQNFRAIYLLFFMCDGYDTPGGNRGMTRVDIIAGTPGAIYKAPTTTTAVVADANWKGNEKKCGMLDFPMERWWGTTPTNTVWRACNTGEPYPIKGEIAMSGDFMNQSNTHYAWEALKQMDFMITIDLWHVPGCEISDIIVPTMHWLEVDGWARMSQGATGAIGAHQNCVEPRGEAKFDLWHVHDFFKAKGKPYFPITDTCPNGLDADVEVFLDAAVAGEGFTWREYVKEFAENGWFDCKVLQPLRWGTYRRYMYGYMRQMDGMQRKSMDWVPGMPTPTMKGEVWSTILETYCSADMETTKNSHGLHDLTDPQICMPYYVRAPLSEARRPDLWKDYKFLLTTGRRIPVYFHSEHRQLPWCRELWPAPRLDINPDDAKALGIEQGDWVWIENHKSKVRQIADISYTMKPGVLNAEHTWWFPEFDDDEPKKGFDLCGINCLCEEKEGDPFYGSSALRCYPVNIYKATPENSPFGNPCPCDSKGNEIIHTPDDPRLKEWKVQIEEIQRNGDKAEVK